MDKTATDLNSPMEVEKRANQEDPIVMYLIVRESLGMGMGKTAAQCAHAAQMLTLQYTSWASFTDSLSCSASEDEEIFEEWLSHSFRKVVLRASDKEWAKIKEQFPKPKSVIVVDAGLTEIAAGSETVIGLWPMKKSVAKNTIVKKLQALK